MIRADVFSALRTAAILLPLGMAGCSGQSGDTAILEPGKVSSIVIGQSSRSDVLALLGQPNHTTWNRDGESWVYQVTDEDLRRESMSNGATIAGGVLGAFVPFGGLIGMGLGMAGSQVSELATASPTTTLVLLQSFGVGRE